MRYSLNTVEADLTGWWIVTVTWALVIVKLGPGVVNTACGAELAHLRDVNPDLDVMRQPNSVVIVPATGSSGSMHMATHCVLVCRG
jgi:hypothetical protein